jgi:hypothetical protein
VRRLARIVVLVAGFVATAWGVALLVQVFVGSQHGPVLLIAGSLLLTVGFTLYRSAGRISF